MTLTTPCLLDLTRTCVDNNGSLGSAGHVGQQGLKVDTAVRRMYILSQGGKSLVLTKYQHFTVIQFRES